MQRTLRSAGRAFLSGLSQDCFPRPKLVELEAPQAVSEAVGLHGFRPRGCLPDERRHSYRSRRYAKLLAKGAAEARRIGKAKHFGDRADRQGVRYVAQYGETLGKASALDVVD